MGLGRKKGNTTFTCIGGRCVFLHFEWEKEHFVKNICFVGKNMYNSISKYRKTPMLLDNR